MADSSTSEAFTYIVECTDGTLYTGWAKDVSARVKVHNAGRGARYTRTRRPVRLRYWECHPDRGAAMRRERQLKRMSRARKLRLIEGFDGGDPVVSPPGDPPESQPREACDAQPEP